MNEISEIDFTDTLNQHVDTHLDIFNYYVEHSTVTSRTEKLDKETFIKSLPIEGRKLKCLSVLNKESIIGFISLKSFIDRDSYNKTAEVSIYLSHEFKGRGIGVVCLERIFAEASRYNIRTLIAQISGENKRSISLIEKYGFSLCGRINQSFEKFNRLHDDLIFQFMMKDLIQLQRHPAKAAVANSTFFV